MKKNRALTKCIFLDRDGTIIEDVDYLSTPSGVKILPGAARGMELLKKDGYLLIIITNQSGVARGYFTEENLAAIHRKMRKLLRAQGADYDDLFYCPHHINGAVEPFNVECDCRKPKTGLLQKAKDKYNIDFSQSFFVGDMEGDIKAGKTAGCRTVLIESPKNAGADLKEKADYYARNLLEAARLIVNIGGKRSSGS